MRSRRIATARHCRRERACVYPAIRDGSRASAPAPAIERVEFLSVTLKWPRMHFGHPRLGAHGGLPRPAHARQVVSQREALWSDAKDFSGCGPAARIIVVLSRESRIRPANDRRAQHDLEHLLIFLATGMAFGFGYPDRFRLPTIIAQPTFALRSLTLGPTSVRPRLR